MTGPWFGLQPRSLSDSPTTPPVDRLGAWLRGRALRRAPSFGNVGDRMVGLAALVGPMLAIVAPPLAVAPLVATAAIAVLRARRLEQARHRALTVGLADVLDLLASAVGAGLPLPSAVEAVEPFAPDVYRPLLADSLRRLSEGEALAAVIGRLAEVVPSSGRRSIALLTAAVRDGTPVGASLRHAAEEARRARRRLVEQRVRRLPVLMLLPLVVCVLPAFVLLTLVPLVLGSLDDLQFPGS